LDTIQLYPNVSFPELFPEYITRKNTQVHNGMILQRRKREEQEQPAEPDPVALNPVAVAQGKTMCSFLMVPATSSYKFLWLINL
jgi:hypothetical protein